VLLPRCHGFYGAPCINVQDLVLYMLEADQFVRGSAGDMIDHPWITVSIGHKSLTITITETKMSEAFASDNSNLSFIVCLLRRQNSCSVRTG